MDTTPALDTALAADQVTFFICGRGDLPGYTLRLLDASGEVTWTQGTFVGFDPLFGVIAGIDMPTDGVGDQAPQLSLTLLPPNETAVATLVNPSQQGSRIRIWLGAISGGSVVVDPYLLFDGELDQPSLVIDKGQREVTYDCVSSFEKLFRDIEGNRLSDANQQDVWGTGELGLQDVTGIVKQVIWGPGDPISNDFSTSGGSNWGFGAFGNRNDYV